MRIDKDKKLKNPRLEGLLARLKELGEGDQDHAAGIMREVIHEIVSSAYFLSVTEYSTEPKTLEDGSMVLDKDTRVSYPSLVLPNGKEYLPLFSSWNELYKWEYTQGREVRTTVHPFDDYMVMVRDNGGIVIDPFGAGITADKAKMQQWKEQVEEASSLIGSPFGKPMRVKVGDPVEYPNWMAEAIREYAKSDDRINKMWLKLMEVEGERSFLLIVDYTGDQAEIFNKIIDVAKPRLPQGSRLDVIPVGGDFAQMAAVGQRFYEKI